MPLLCSSAVKRLFWNLLFELECYWQMMWPKDASGWDGCGMELALFPMVQSAAAKTHPYNPKNSRNSKSKTSTWYQYNMLKAFIHPSIHSIYVIITKTAALRSDCPKPNLRPQSSYTPPTPPAFPTPPVSPFSLLTIATYELQSSENSSSSVLKMAFLWLRPRPAICPLRV